LSREILVIHDGSKQAGRAIERALALTLWAESEPHVMYMSESPPQFASTIGEVDGVVGRPNILKKLMGNRLSTSQTSAHLAPCTVLTVK
jgi:nucleotide-binding universal stress UspA family protein